MARTEYYDDPDAPKPNSMVVAASAVVTDEEGSILLQRRRDNDLWALPGGGMDMAGSLPGAAVREVEEETGLEVEITGLVGTYTDPRQSGSITPAASGPAPSAHRTVRNSRTATANAAGASSCTQ